MLTRKRWLGALAVGGVAAGLLVGSADATPSPDPTVVRTDAGPVRGTAAADSLTFQGIPYAAAPVGPLRWRPPQPVRTWTEPRDATVPASPCPQQANPEAPKGSANEDCLYLNVTVPRGHDDHRPKPVVVWMPGGGFFEGAGSSYAAHRMAVQGDAVVVTVNYRLGIFGFFGLPGLPGSGTFGLADQQAALRWVRHNAAAFGGDAGNVTLAGESAGGMSTCAQLTSPTSTGLFDKAIMQSGSCEFSWPSNSQYPGQAAGAPWVPQSAVRQNGSQVAAQLGCPAGPDPAACMRALPASALVERSTSFVSPAYDTEVLPQNPATAVRDGRLHRVPVLSGNNHDEARAWVATFDGGKIDAAGYHRLLVNMVGERQAARVEAQYPVSAYPSPALAWAAATTDRIWSCTQASTDRQLARHVPTYAYEFSDQHSPLIESQPSPIPLGAAHAMELPYLFELGGWESPFAPDQKRLSDQMIGYWTAFAHSGDPNGAGRPHWAPLPSGAPGVNGLSLAPSGQGDIRPVDLAAEHHCDFWAGLR